MKKLGSEKKHGNKGSFYRVVIVNNNEIGKTIVDDEDEGNGKPF